MLRRDALSDCRRFFRDLEALHDGELRGARRAGLLRHLEGCPRCNAQLLRLEETDRLIASARPAAPSLEPVEAAALFQAALAASGVQARRRAPWVWCIASLAGAAIIGGAAYHSALPQHGRASAVMAVASPVAAPSSEGPREPASTGNARANLKAVAADRPVSRRWASALHRRRPHTHVRAALRLARGNGLDASELPTDLRLAALSDEYGAGSRLYRFRLMVVATHVEAPLKLAVSVRTAAASEPGTACVATAEARADGGTTVREFTSSCDPSDGASHLDGAGGTDFGPSSASGR